jgi:hypothetical protein
MSVGGSKFLWKTILTSVVAAVAVGVEIAYLGFPRQEAPPVPPAVPQAVEATDRQAHEMCAACHAFTDPSNFPRSVWRSQVQNGYGFLADAHLPLHPPPMENMVHYFENRASASLPPPDKDHPGPCPVRFKPVRFSESGVPAPVISNVNLVHLSSLKTLDLLVCDMKSGNVMLMKPYEPSPRFRVLAKLGRPCHTQVVDLDGDGIKDILVADLGEFRPTDAKAGRVIWLRGHADGTYTPYTLLDGVGRVDDVEMADFNGDGRNDLVVAEFGHSKTGSILWLENQTTDWSHPKFIPHTLDGRAGTIHVPVCDLNHDGRPDFVALISNEHETVVAFINQGGGRFIEKTIFTGSSPALGSDSIQLTRLSPGQKPGVLYAAGDMFDTEVPRHIQGIYWLDNRGAYPYSIRKLTTMYGAMRAITANVKNNGLPSVFAVSLAPDLRNWLNPAALDSVVYLDQTAPGKFERYALEKGSCNHATCDAGDMYGDGRTDLVTGNFNFGPTKDPTAITIWRNVGLRSTTQSASRH